MNLENLETPALILDRDKMMHNIHRMRKHLGQFDVALRPHVKTSKNVEVVDAMQGGDRGAITVSTLAEAEYFFSHGFRDILYAVAIAPQKLDHVAALMKAGLEIRIILDSIEAAKIVVQKGRDLDCRFKVLIEIDSDGHRAGLKPDDFLIVEIGRVLNEGGVNLLGVMTHAGGSYNSKTIDQIIAYADQERLAVVQAKASLEQAGLGCPVVSVGSTPTALFSQNMEDVTEVRAGVYVFQDLVMAGIGVCEPADIALSVLCSVIGHQREKGHLIVDAGWMAMSRDRGTSAQTLDQGYGLVCDLQGGVFGDLVVKNANQEHGIIADRYDREIDHDLFPVGTYLRILPIHACATAAQHDHYWVVEGEQKIEEKWVRQNGW